MKASIFCNEIENGSLPDISVMIKIYQNANKSSAMLVMLDYHTFKKVLLAHHLSVHSLTVKKLAKKVNLKYRR